MKMEQVVMFSTLHPYVLGSVSLAVTGIVATFVYKYHWVKPSSVSNSQELVPLDMKSAKSLFNVDYDVWSDEVVDDNPKDETVKLKSVNKLQIDGLVTRTVDALLKIEKFNNAFHNAELHDQTLLEENTNPKIATKNVLSIYVGKYIFYQIGLSTLFEKNTLENVRITSYLNAVNLATWCNSLCEGKPGIEGFKEWIKLYNLHLANVVNTFQPNNSEYRIALHVRNYEKFLNFVKENNIASDLTYTTKKFAVNQLDYHIALYDAAHKVAEKVATVLPQEAVIKAADPTFWSKLGSIFKIFNIFS